MWGQNMKTVRTIFLAVMGLAFATVAQAQNGASSGKIRFIGQVVEGGCGVALQRSQAQISCYYNGVNHIQHVAIKSIGNISAMPGIATVTQRSLNGHPELQELTITYL